MTVQAIYEASAFLALSLVQQNSSVTLAPAQTGGQRGKTAIFLTLWDDLLWFFEETLP